MQANHKLNGLQRVNFYGLPNISLIIVTLHVRALLKKLRDRVGMKQVKEKKGNVKAGSNPKVQWHGSKGEHGTHNGAKKGDVYITLKPSMSANNLAHPGKAVPSGGSGY